jgi:hypothetical protein
VGEQLLQLSGNEAAAADDDDNLMAFSWED